MEFLTLAILSAIAVLLAARLPRRGLVPASANDWFVVFDINAEEKVLALWFYPIVAFEQKANQTHPVTSRPDFTAKLAISRPATKVNDSMWGVSVSYGRWLRDGVPFDENGNPDYQNTSNFEDTIHNHLLGQFKLRFATLFRPPTLAKFKVRQNGRSATTGNRAQIIFDKLVRPDSPGRNIQSHSVSAPFTP